VVPEAGMTLAGRRLKTLARAVAPRPLRSAWGRFYGDMKIRRARRAFEDAAADAAFLPPAVLTQLMQRAYVPPDRVRYDAEGLIARATDKVAQLQRVVDLATVGAALELGCWDGMVGAALAERGVRVCGLDISTAGVDPRASHGGVRFLQSDAGAIALADASIDLVYSFASLEHFPQPDRCLAEIERVLRPGGHVFINFGPLYFSPYGRHAYRQIPVPFCHLLFEEPALHQWASDAGLPHDWPYVNGWTLQRYRNLWKAASSRFAIRSYTEYSTGGVGVELIAQYPHHFRGQASNFDEFLITAVDIALQKH
jgi:SAM-dependent methyltransferase